MIFPFFSGIVECWIHRKFLYVFWVNTFVLFKDDIRMMIDEPSTVENNFSSTLAVIPSYKLLKSFEML